MNFIAFLLLVVASVCIGGMAEARKAFQVKNGTGLQTTLAFSAINSVFATIVCLFFVRQYDFNISRLGLSLIYAAVTVTISSLCLVGSAWGNVTMLIASANLGGLVFPSIYGLISDPQNNKLTIIRVFGFIFALMCIVILILGDKSDKKNLKYKISCIIVFLTQGSALIIFSIIDKYFGTKQYFNFMAEYMLISAIILLPLVFILGKGKHEAKKSKLFTKHNLLFAFIYAVLFFASEFISLKCVSLVPLTFQAPVSFCIPIIVTSLLERFIYRIKIQKNEWIQIVLAVASCICFMF